MTKTTLALFLMVAPCCCPAVAARDASGVDREVDALLADLRGSDCRFNRNGTWHEGKEAADHLARKYGHLRSRVSSTEQFLEKGASASSISGRKYLVQCGDGSPVPSGEWLAGRLRTLRASGAIVPPRPDAR